jgi:nucleoid-associated protein YgaU
MSGPARGPCCVWRLAFCAVIFASFCAGQAHGQDVAAAARQEKARKAAEQQIPHHVYTDNDLKRKVILSPEDQARVEARKKQQDSGAAEQDASAKPQPRDSTTATESLGESARRDRREKAERDAALAARKKFTPFPYNVPKHTLAEPKTGTVPLTGILPGLIERRAEIAPEVRSTPKMQPPVARVHHGRISPFEPRPLLGSSAALPPAIAVEPYRPVRPVAPVSGIEGRAVADPGSARLTSIQVAPGQSWWRLAEAYLGNGARWRELRKLNAEAGGSPKLLKAGSVVVIPANGRVVRASSQTLTVSKGDSLWSLAEHRLGRGSAWSCLANANPQISDYTHLAVGTILQLPSGGVRSCQQRKVDLVRR